MRLWTISWTGLEVGRTGPDIERTGSWVGRTMDCYIASFCTSPGIWTD